MSKYFAQLDNNKKVLQVIAASDLDWCVKNLGGEWVETFMDREDKNYAGVGHNYKEDKQNFHTDKPFESWTLNEKLQWEAPKKLPNELKGQLIDWDEEKQEWIKLKP